MYKLQKLQNKDNAKYEIILKLQNTGGKIMQNVHTTTNN